MLQVTWRVGLVALAGWCLIASPAAAQDNVEGPWGTTHGDIYGRMRVTEPVVLPFGTGTGAVEAWRVDTTTLGLRRPASRNMIVFDADGNIYWRTTAGNNKLASMAPGGTLRWIAQDDTGGDFVFGMGWNSTTPVVGEERVYALGAGMYGPSGEWVVAAFNKDDGSLIWKTLLANVPFWIDDTQLTPILYDGKLYVAGYDFGELRIHQLDAASGAIDWEVPLSFVLYDAGGQAVLVPQVFPNGDHGMYVQVRNGDGLEGLPEVFGIRIDPDPATGGASFEWEAQGAGPVARTHLIYNPEAPNSGGAGRIYAHTWNDWGNTIYAYDPITGNMFANGGEQPAGGHGYYDVGGVDWDDTTIFAGGFDGRIGLYTDNGDNTFTADVVAYNPWFGEPRVFGQLVRDCAGNSVLITGTNSRSDMGPDHEARVIVTNLSGDVHGAYDDGPLYMDDLKIWDGGVLIVDETFDNYPLGTLAGNGDWIHDNQEPSGHNVNNPVVVVDDPVAPGNNVIMLDAAGSDGGWIGAYLEMADAWGPQVVVQWRQWRADVTDNFWYAFGDSPNDFNGINGWGVCWDISHTMTSWQWEGVWDNRSLPPTPGVWETVEITHDYSAFTATIQIEATTADPVTAIGGMFWTGFDIQLGGTAISSGYNEAMVEFNTGIVADHAFTVRAGPLLGPDPALGEPSKIYYFDNEQLVALEPETVKGDSNCDGAIDAFDIDLFVTALVSPGSWPGPCDFIGANDLNNDGAVDSFDIDPFVALLTGQCP